MLTINDMPKKLVLTCTKTGKQTTWLNREIMLKKAQEFGSLEAFVAQYVCREAKAGKTVREVVTKPKVVKAIFEQGKKLGEMSQEEYQTQYRTRVYNTYDREGNEVFPRCTVVAPVPPAAKLGN